MLLILRKSMDAITNILKSKKGLTILVLAILAIAVPLTIVQVQNQQEGRSRAGGGAVSVSLTPQSSNVSVGENLVLEVKINASGNNITAADITFTYDAGRLNLTSNGLQASSVFTTIQNGTTIPRTIHYVGVNPSSSDITGNEIMIGTLAFTATEPGQATVGFSNIHINASGVDGALPIDTDNTKNGTYTISSDVNIGDPTPTAEPTTTDPTNPTPIGDPCWAFNTCPSPTQTLTGNNAVYDFNDDGKVDEKDLNILYSGFSRRQGD